MAEIDIDLYELISWKRVDELEAALKAGADPNQLDPYGQTPIFRVVYNRSAQQAHMLKLLLEHGADANHRHDADGETAIHNATSTEIAEILLAHGADLAIKSSIGGTPLHSVTSAEMAQFFIDKGINVNARDDYGATALMDAGFEGHELVECLLKNGAAADVRNEKGQTTVMRLADDPFIDDDEELQKIATLLIEAGTPLDALDNEGQSAIDIARKSRHQHLAAFLANIQKTQSTD
ncbi:MAG: ankyrin repeat domain-containing protein [Kordiimonadaceae bacterium]|nr:ankyrin repeat domain-containing protein [Kordiimonadaceae bacterium]MBO6567397.1 ankyrin repeat domain-containing protein [Kordiimonadaceae bacterium]MBO6963389.1 ankyrin repeat domain-containing protein [Kordiimonadaceae bacterium]